MELKTERLVIRRFQEADAADLYAYLGQAEVVKYEPYEPFTYEQAVAEAKRRAGDPNFYAVTLKQGKLIGNLYLAAGAFATWELGYVFNAAYWGQGYARESAAALLSQHFAEQGMRRVTALCNPANEGSWRLLESLGFVREGRLRQMSISKRMSRGSHCGRIPMSTGCCRKNGRCQGATDKKILRKSTDSITLP